MQGDWDNFAEITMGAAHRRCRNEQGWQVTIEALSMTQGLVELACDRPGERVLFDARRVDHLSSDHVEQALFRQAETGASEVHLAFPSRTVVPTQVSELATYLGVGLVRLPGA